MPNESPVTDVSDTARWVAIYRALESERDDALFRDPYARRLAGERGRAIAADAPEQARSGWPEVVRTRLIDDLVGASVAEGCDRVLNLAAGFDTRPYRMALPGSLQWVEADFDGVLAEKERALEGARPRCRVRRERVDLRDARQRRRLLEESTAEARSVLVITEGLLGYLDPEVVRDLVADLARPIAVRWWILDVLSGAVLKKAHETVGAYLEKSPLKFAPSDGVAFFERSGWRSREIRSVSREAARLGRVGLLRRLRALLPPPNPRSPGTLWSGVVRLERGRSGGD